MNTRGICAHCNDHRLLPGRSPTNEMICRDCAGITTTLTCNRCGQEAERVRHGLCARCDLTENLTAILRPNDPADLRLHRLIRELTSTTRPESIRSWIRRPPAAAILHRIGTRELTLSHVAFDREQPSPAVEHVREMLVHHQILPTREDIRLVRFQAWLDKRLSTFADHPHLQQPLEQFARWHHLRRLRGDPPPANMENATRAAKQEITETGRFLLWLHTEHDTYIDQLRQEHIDLYWSEGPSTRTHIRNFLQQRGLTGHRRALTANARQAQSTPSITGRERLEQLRHVIDADQVTLSTRIAAIILLLYGTPLGTIASLTVEDINATPTEMTISLGRQPAPVPDALIPLFSDYLTNRSHTGTMNKNSPWLFPSSLAGQHINPDTLQKRLKIFGIYALSTRNATLADLALELDPASLAALLGYSAKVITKHVARAGNTMAGYPALVTAPSRTDR